MACILKYMPYVLKHMACVFFDFPYYIKIMGKWYFFGLSWRMNIRLCLFICV